FRFAYSLTHEATRADDLVQDAWLAVLRARGPWTIEYLLVAIRSRFHDQCRRDGLAGFSALREDDAVLNDDSGLAGGTLEGGDGPLDENEPGEKLPPGERGRSSGLITKSVPQTAAGGDAEGLWIDAETLDRALARLRPEERVALYLAVVEERTAR